MTSYITVTVTELYNIKKDIKGSRTNNIIQSSNSILILWQIYVL